jgi:hypothetical protein
MTVYFWAGNFAGNHCNNYNWNSALNWSSLKESPGSGDPGFGDPGLGDPGSGDPGSGGPGSGDNVTIECAGFAGRAEYR